MQIIAKTDKGIIRTENQDRVRFKLLNDGAAVIVVCDGMGGENAGSEASEIAANAIFDRLVLNYRDEADNNSIRNLLFSSINAANQIVYEKSLSDDTKVGMGTTCVCGVIKNEIAFIVNVGDSRAYVINSDGIQQISTDHTYVQMLFEQGKINREEIKTHTQKNVITRAVGIEEKIELDYFEVDLLPESVVLMCTDGLTNYCSDEVICETVKHNDIESALSKLIKYANEHGGKDNITVAMAAN